MAGGLVGTNYGAITSSYASGRVSSNWLAGGLVGTNYGAIGSSYASARVSGEWHVGGLVGFHYSGTVTASYATGPVSGDTNVGGLIGSNGSGGQATASYATGPVSGNTDVGGLIGHNAGVVSASYWDTSTSGRTTGSGGAGQSTSALQGPTGYAGLYAAWDVDVDGDGTADAPWTFGTASEYPVLSMDVDGDGAATWQEFGRQLRSGPVGTAWAGTGEVVVSWTAVDASAWTPSPSVTYAVYRTKRATVERLASGLAVESYTDTTVESGVAYTYQVAAEVWGGETTRSGQVTPTTGNRPPAAVGSLSSLLLGVSDGAVTVDVSGAFSDPDADVLTYTAASSAPSVATVLVSGSVLTVAPVSSGVTTVTVTATDAGGSSGTATQTFAVTVSNGAPVAVGTLPDRTLRVSDGAVAVDVSGAFSDPDGDPLTYAAVSSAPGVATVSVSGSVLTVVPVSSGSATVTVTATDGVGTATQSFVVTVPNGAPVAVGTLSDRTLRVSDGSVSVDVSGAFSDADGDALTYTAASSAPAVATVSVSGSVLTVTPVSSGSATVSVTATDAGGSSGTATQTFVVTVSNEAPVAVGTLPDRTLRVSDGSVTVEVSGAFSDADGDALSYTASSSRLGWRRWRYRGQC